MLSLRSIWRGVHGRLGQAWALRTPDASGLKSRRMTPAPGLRGPRSFPIRSC